LKSPSLPPKDFLPEKGRNEDLTICLNTISKNHKRLFDNNEPDLTKLAQMTNLKQQPEEIQTFNI
jgi:hypothetical protein